MKINTFSNKIILSIVAIVSFAMLTSFKDHRDYANNNACVISCAFNPTSGPIASAGFDNCNTVQSHGTIAAGTSWVPVLNHFGCGTGAAGIAITLPAIHPAGTVTIKKNGAVVGSWTLAANAPFSQDVGYSASCGTSFEVLW